MGDEDKTLLNQDQAGDDKGADDQKGGKDSLSDDSKKAADQKAADDAAKAASDKEAADKEAADKAAADKAAKDAEGAPEEYADFTAPEGVTLDEGLMGEFTPMAKELNLTQDQAQKLLDLQMKHVDGLAKTQGEAFETMKENWAKDVVADEEIGGAGYDENIEVAKKAVATFSTPEFKAYLDESGLGNHPEMVRLFVRVGKAISEDKLVQGEVKGERKGFYPPPIKKAPAPFGQDVKGPDDAKKE